MGGPVFKTRLRQSFCLPAASAKSRTAGENTSEHGGSKAVDGVVRLTSVAESLTQQWLQDAQTKSTLGVYLANKKTIASKVRLYDNSLGSRFLFEARAGALRTLCYRRRFDTTVTSKTCRVCGVNDKTVEHSVLDCARLEPSLSQNNGPRLPKPLALAEALGFTDSEIGQFTAVCPATGMKVASNDTKTLVANTKRRLKDWWQKIDLRKH
ncbi:hypothetical protein HPB47_026863 [Ixodes persulcatus]|uniref:Uncharacterized protein n=1 Tax=Ixodes persulcatus TaxID=34615 RepID=A0AC60PYZ8_IXOPE|nr:hypothetical protein HPB47_026863 [Ixodes persulcatus]